MKTRQDDHIEIEPRPDAYILMDAEQFFNAAELIANSENINFSHYSSPLVVNYAFSCELSLKASEGLVKFSEVSPDGYVSSTNSESAVRGHNLYKIFTNLKPETQNAIESEFATCAGERLIPLLKECSDYFEKWRYSYEQKGGGYSLANVRTLAKGLLDSVTAFGKNHA